MEPVKGGTLAKLPKGAVKYFSEMKPDQSSASWAMRWVAAHPNVKVILSGMSNLEQVKDNIENFSPYVTLDNEEMKVINNVGEYLLKRVKNGCSGCSYCMPCPVGVDIPRNFRIWNDYGMYRNKGETGWLWNQDLNEKAKAKNCIECGKCEKVCPQQISIRSDLKKLQNELDALK
jgi:predicted aldo/keto reductase-like oxidoreductase